MKIDRDTGVITYIYIYIYALELLLLSTVLNYILEGISQCLVHILVNRNTGSASNLCLNMHYSHISSK